MTKRRAVFEIREASEVATFWFLGANEVPGDVLAVVYRDSATAPWQSVIRIRTHMDTRIWGTTDRIRTMRAEPPPDLDAPSDAARDHLVNETDRAMIRIAEQLGVRLGLSRTEVYGSGEDFLTALRQQPFAHWKTEPADPKS